MALNTTFDGEAGIPPAAYLLADHLDRALAAIEDLEAEGARWPAEDPSDEAGDAELQRHIARCGVVDAIRRHETHLIGSVLRARHTAQDLAGTSSLFSGLTRLFIGGTAALVDAVEELGDPGPLNFETGNDSLAYLRRRGLVEVQSADLPASDSLAIDADFLVAGRIALGPLADMIVAYLDALESQYDLYPADQEADVGDESEGDWPAGCALTWPEATATSVEATSTAGDRDGGAPVAESGPTAEAALEACEERTGDGSGESAAVSDDVLAKADEPHHCSLIARLDAVAAFAGSDAETDAQPSKIAD